MTTKMFARTGFLILISLGLAGCSSHEQPVEFVYGGKSYGALQAAQQQQLADFRRTSVWRPVTRQGHPGELEDQLYNGYLLASKMNARYFYTAPNCVDGRPAYYCNGVILRRVQADPERHAWNPSEGSIANDSVAFTYVRADTGITSLIRRGPVYTVKELAAAAAHPMQPKCIFPTDGFTSERPDGCGQSPGEPLSGNCFAQGIDTVEKWQAFFKDNHGNWQQCSFFIDLLQFQFSIDVRAHFPPGSEWNREYFNELVMKAWPQNIPTQLPLESFIFDGTGPLADTQFIQRDYYNVTQRFLPILRMNLSATDRQIFSYFPEDQDVAVPR